jgi:hypothetical protein
MRLNQYLKILAPYGLLSAPILLWLLMPGKEIEGIFGHVVLEAAVVYLGFGACALVMGKRHPGSAALLGGLLLLAFVQVEHDPLPGEGNLRMAHMHLADSTAPAGQIAAEATSLGLDFLSLSDPIAIGSGSARMDELACALQDKFPYTFHCFNDQDSGVAVFSRYPLEALAVEWWGERPHISGRVGHPGGSVAFVAGGGPDSIKTGNRMESIAHHIENQGGPRILLDAFAELPTGATLSEFKRQSSLRDGRTAWTDVHPEMVELIPDSVDYILHSPEIRCLDFQTYETGVLRGVVGTFSIPPSLPPRNTTAPAAGPIEIDPIEIDPIEIGS